LPVPWPAGPFWGQPVRPFTYCGNGGESNILLRPQLTSDFGLGGEVGEVGVVKVVTAQPGRGAAFVQQVADAAVRRVDGAGRVTG